MYSLSELERIISGNCLDKKFVFISLPRPLSKLSTIDKSRSGFSVELIEDDLLETHKTHILPSVFKKKYNIYCIEIDNGYEFLVTTKDELNIDRIDYLIDLLHYHYDVEFEFKNITNIYKYQSRNKKFPSLETLKRDNKKYEREKLYKEIQSKKNEIEHDKKILKDDEKDLEKLISKLTTEEKLLYEIGELKWQDS